MSSTSVHQRSIIIIGEANIFCIKISVMTFLESGKEYQSIRSSKGLNFRDGCLTFGVPLWHDLCSSSPNIFSVNRTICLGNENLPSCWLAGEKQSEQQDLAFFFYRRHSRTNVRFDHLFSETAPLQMTTHNICWFNKKKSLTGTPEFALHFRRIWVSLRGTLGQKQKAEMKNVIWDKKINSAMSYKSNKNSLHGWPSCVLQTKLKQGSAVIEKHGQQVFVLD